MGYKKAFLQNHIESILNNAHKEMKKNIKKAIESGAIDIDSYDTENNPMVLPKAVVIALLETEAEQYKGKGTAFEKQVAKDVKNIKKYL